jgi:hypothetical protein
MAAIILGLFHYGPLRHVYVYRYVEHPVQWVEVVFFCCCLGALLGKLGRILIERRACGIDILPRWDGKPIPVAKASDLLASIDRQSARVQGTYLGRRIRAVLEFLCQRRSAADLDDHLRTLTDNDAMAQENSFALVRFITWAIPILGFLGTVIGITGAIAGVTPEVLEESMSAVTDGLAEAFDSTALALGLTMIAMFITFLVEKQEQGILEEVDHLVDRQLAHRFIREGLDSAPILDAVRMNSEILTRSVEGLVQRQAELWADSLSAPERRVAGLYEELQTRLTTAMQQAMESTAHVHAQRLAALEQHMVQQSTHLLQNLAGLAAAIRDVGQQQTVALVKVAEGIQGQAAVLGKLQADEANLIHLQAVLHQNLAALASASSFEEAVQTLTAAVHLLTTRVGGTSQLRVTHGKAA